MTRKRDTEQCCHVSLIIHQAQNRAKIDRASA